LHTHLLDLTILHPEVIARGHNNVDVVLENADVWAFGVIMWEMVSGYRAHLEKSKEGIEVLVTSGKGAMTPPAYVPQAYKVCPDLSTWLHALLLVTAVVPVGAHMTSHRQGSSSDSARLLILDHCGMFLLL
jgi:hypothetical protein